MKRKLSFIDCIVQCKTKNQFSQHQREIERKLKNWYGNTRVGTLLSRKSELMHDLKVETEKNAKKENIFRKKADK